MLHFGCSRVSGFRAEVFEALGFNASELQGFRALGSRLRYC